MVVPTLVARLHTSPRTLRRLGEDLLHLRLHDDEQPLTDTDAENLDTSTA